MRGESSKQMSMLVLRSPGDMVPKEHPLRAVKKLADAALKEMSARFDKMYAKSGRESVPPETLLKGSLLIALYTLRSERMLCEQLGYNMLFRWFLDMDMTETPFDHSTFSKNRERIMEHDVAGEFFKVIVEQARKARLMSSEHVTVDGTTDRSLGIVEDIFAEGRREKGQKSSQGEASQRSQRQGRRLVERLESDGRLPRREAQQRNASVDDRSGIQTVSKG